MDCLNVSLVAKRLERVAFQVQRGAQESVARIRTSRFASNTMLGPAAQTSKRASAAFMATMFARRLVATSLRKCSPMTAPDMDRMSKVSLRPVPSSLNFVRGQVPCHQPCVKQDSDGFTVSLDPVNSCLVVVAKLGGLGIVVTEVTSFSLMLFIALSITANSCDINSMLVVVTNRLLFIML